MGQLPRTLLVSSGRVTALEEAAGDGLHFTAIKLDFSPDPLGEVFLLVIVADDETRERFLSVMKEGLGEPVENLRIAGSVPWLEEAGAHHYFWIIRPTGTHQGH